MSSAQAAEAAADELAALAAQPLTADVDALTDRLRSLNDTFDRVARVEGGREALDALLLRGDAAEAPAPLLLQLIARGSVSDSLAAATLARAMAAPLFLTDADHLDDDVLAEIERRFSGTTPSRSSVARR